ncbi:MAG TPA: PfkB family carbohydrate kinase, partial [Mycoplana sp.]|nr:PfkB family carbohydrate kinase [Mycoplana sp.]
MITVFGSINMDLIATTARLPQPSETVPGHSFSTAAGGKGANQALASRRAGSVVRMA